MGMYVVWLSPAGCGGFTGISRDANMCSGFPQPQAALVTVAFGEKGLWVVGCNSGEIRVKEQGGGSALTGFKYMLGLSMYGGGH